MKLLPMSPVRLLPMSPVYTPLQKGGFTWDSLQENDYFPLF